MSASGLSAREFLIHEDRACLVFNKPAGLASQGGSGLHEHLESLVAASFARPGKKPPRLVHRLDRETSGVILLARTQPAAAFFSAVFAERRAQKTYLALVSGGAPDPAEGEITLALVKTKAANLDVMRPALEGEAQAQQARTVYRTLAATTAGALVHLAPETGRMHQLRAHLAAIGRPIAGDGRYGGLLAIGGERVSRVMLHAARLQTPHPEGGNRVFEAPPPDDWRALAARLGLDPDLGMD